MPRRTVPEGEGRHRLPLLFCLFSPARKAENGWKIDLQAIAASGERNEAGGSERGFPAEVERRLAVPSKPSDQANGPLRGKVADISAACEMYNHTRWGMR